MRDNEQSNIGGGYQAQANAALYQKAASQKNKTELDLSNSIGTKLMTQLINNALLVLTTTTKTIEDSGASGNFIGPNLPFIDKQLTIHGIIYVLLNGNLITYSHNENIDKSHLGIIPPQVAAQASVFNTFGYKSHISLGLLCDAGCNVMLTPTSSIIIEEQK